MSVVEFRRVLEECGARKPRGVVETGRVATLSFGVITNDMAEAYGEGERTVEWWRREMDSFYGERLALSEAILTDDTPLLWEWFAVTRHP
jgi:uncharacterized protein YhfF